MHVIIHRRPAARPLRLTIAILTLLAGAALCGCGDDEGGSGSGGGGGQTGTGGGGGTGGGLPSGNDTWSLTLDGGETFSGSLAMDTAIASNMNIQLSDISSEGSSATVSLGLLDVGYGDAGEYSDNTTIELLVVNADGDVIYNCGWANTGDPERPLTISIATLTEAKVDGTFTLVDLTCTNSATATVSGEGWFDF